MGGAVGGGGLGICSLPCRPAQGSRVCPLFRLCAVTRSQQQRSDAESRMVYVLETEKPSPELMPFCLLLGVGIPQPAANSHLWDLLESAFLRLPPRDLIPWVRDGSPGICICNFPGPFW